MRASALAVVALLAGCPVTSATTAGGATTTPGPTSATNAGGGASAGGGEGAAPAPAPGGKLTVPDLRGKSFADAVAIVKRAGFAYELEQEPLGCDNDKPANGTVRCQNPDAGATVDVHAFVRVEIYQERDRSGELVRAQTASLIGLTVDEAKKKLAAMGYTGHLEIFEDKAAPTRCKRGTVCRVHPDELGKDAPLDLTISTAAPLEITAPP